jgi:methionyl-tRNA synthetase
MENKFYITTPIYYVNDVPHIGHAYTTVAADVLSRHYKKQGKDVYFLTGTDEHGAKIAEAAEKAGKRPQEFVDELAPKFGDAWERLDIRYDDFFRTTNPEHEVIVQDFIKKLQKKGYVEKRKYEGLYCVGCEKFYMPDELIDGNKCPIHQKEVIKHEEENYFFLLSKLEKQLLKEIESEKNIKIRPETRKNEVISKIKGGLEDVSISREAVGWGVIFPEDPSQTVYVWVDALLNYYSATKIFENAPVWPADVHLMAKDILWFHAIIWPAMLLAVGEALPKLVFAHGFFTIEGQKMSKSLGNVLDPNYLADKYGKDALRYALLREFPFGEDGDISEEKIAQRYTGDLANGLGNLLNRTLSMVNKYELKVEIKQVELDWKGFAKGEPLDFREVAFGKLESLNFFDFLSDIWNNYIKPANSLIDEKKPWELAKEKKIDELTEVLRQCLINLYKVQNLIEPVMPETAEKMKRQLDSKQPEPLFPRLENVN